MSSFIDFGLAQKQYNRMNKITQLFNIKYPIVQGGMIWHSGWRLASAVSNNGGLGLIGSASMYPDVLRENIRKCNNFNGDNFIINNLYLVMNMLREQRGY